MPYMDMHYCQIEQTHKILMELSISNICKNQIINMQEYVTESIFWKNNITVCFRYLYAGGMRYHTHMPYYGNMDIH
jgi:hypothetical protein